MAGLSHRNAPAQQSAPQQEPEQQPQADPSALLGNGFLGESVLGGGEGALTEEEETEVQAMKSYLTWASGWLKDSALAMDAAQDMGILMEVTQHASKLNKMAGVLDKATKVTDLALLMESVVDAYNATERLLAAADQRDREGARAAMEEFVSEVASASEAIPIFGSTYGGVLSNLVGPLGEIAAELVISSNWAPYCESPDAHLWQEECEGLGYEVNPPVDPKWGPGVVRQ